MTAAPAVSIATSSSVWSAGSSLTSNRSCMESDLHLLLDSHSVNIGRYEKKGSEEQSGGISFKKKKFTLCCFWQRNHNQCDKTVTVMNQTLKLKPPDSDPAYLTTFI